MATAAQNGMLYCTPVAVLLEMAGNVLASQPLRTATHALQNLAGDSFVNTQSLHSSHKLVVQFPCPLNLQITQHASMTDCAKTVKSTLRTEEPIDPFAYKDPRSRKSELVTTQHNTTGLGYQHNDRVMAVSDAMFMLVQKQG